MNRVKIRDIEETKCELYDPENILIGTIDSEIKLDDVRIQIKNKKLRGYYILFDVNGEINRIDIDHQGNLSDWPEGFYEIRTNQLEILFK